MTLAHIVFNSLAHPVLEYDNRLKSAQVVPAGSTLVLKVNISGIPSPTVSWLLDDEPLQKSDRISMETNEDFSILTVKNTVLDDTGLYTICAENVVGRAEADFEISVKGKSFIKKIKFLCESKILKMPQKLTHLHKLSSREDFVC